MVAYKYVTQQKKNQWNVCMVYNGLSFNLLVLVFWWKTVFGIHRLSVVYRLYVVVIIWMLLFLGTRFSGLNARSSGGRGREDK